MRALGGRAEFFEDGLCVDCGVEQASGLCACDSPWHPSPDLATGLKAPCQQCGLPDCEVEHRPHTDHYAAFCTYRCRERCERSEFIEETTGV